ncbi:S1/P1 nuclease [Aliikangiella marina]|uniref:S1/P1 nuclease n=1 Tax=Aliikangiella marina TaxID=1712262 RepID=A0A545THM1_9GAMM|nr:S1/P1 nuclease [Aliikangiella marina]TQV76727.1 S1/P1 nuclease [Aliikangiella marina]
MKQLIVYGCGLFLAAQVTTTPVSALGQNGHRITGELAEIYLTEDAKNQIDAILDNESLAEISTYVDQMRSEPTTFWRKTSRPFHYVTVPDGKTYAQVGAPPQGDAVTALEKYKTVLLDSKSSREDKALAIKWIVHIIADLHQPLHVGNGLDRGGNNFKVTYFGKETNLHSVWDTEMIEGFGLSYSEFTNWLARKITQQQVKQWQATDPLVWIEESQAIRADIYPKDTNLRFSYPHKHLPTLKVRMQQAGVRIALYLNEIFAQTKD